jgi:hypothetical protein
VPAFIKERYICAQAACEGLAAFYAELVNVGMDFKGEEDRLVALKEVPGVPSIR